MKRIKLISAIALLLFVTTLFAQKSPQFQEGQDPKPSNQKWVLVQSMSDEFEGKKIDEKKWQISGQGWIGRAPGLFLPENVKVANGSLQITATKMPKPVTKKSNVFTHGGGYVGSRESATYGYYECEMRANKTFMSSTFWLINDRKDSDGCYQRTIELDIQECVGQINTEKPFAQDADERMGFNTHSRGIKEGCMVPSGSVGGKTSLGAKAHEEFHVYGAWWKNKDEVLFFLDGKFIEKIKPAADFNLPMYLRMVVETYDWNPVPEDGGMTGSIEDRTTTYNWVRAWKLVD